jgi:hypothetical protein
MGDHDKLNTYQIAEAKRWAALTKSKTADFHPSAPQPLTDEQIDRITDAQWGKGCAQSQYMAHRAYARAIERAHGIHPAAETATQPESGTGSKS